MNSLNFYSILKFYKSFTYLQQVFILFDKLGIIKSRSKNGGYTMEKFNKISIQEISKKDMFTIINALDIAGHHTRSNDYKELKDQIIEQLCELADCDEEEFLLFLQS